MNKDFEADKMVAFGVDKVEVVNFNGMMGICGDDDGCVLITKQQAMKFFDLKENK